MPFSSIGFGGGLASGIALAVKLINPQVKIIGVEPENVPGLYESGALSCGRAITHSPPTPLPMDIAVRTAESSRLSSVAVISTRSSQSPRWRSWCPALSSRNTNSSPKAEGVLSLAALSKLRMKDKKVAVLISGGNIDISTISALISRHSSRGRVFKFLRSAAGQTRSRLYSPSLRFSPIKMQMPCYFRP